MKPPDSKATGGATTRRHLHSPLVHLRSNIVAYVALAVAVGSGGSYALAATASNGTIAVCVDPRTSLTPRCGHGQSRIGLSSAKAAASCTSPSTHAAAVIRAASGSARRSTARR